jgi:glycogen synthase
MESHDKRTGFCLEDASRNHARQFYELALTALEQNDDLRSRR